MSAIAGIAAKALPIASKVIGAMPIVGGIAKKVVGGIRSIFGGGNSDGQRSGGFSGMVDSARNFAQNARGMIDAGRQVYQGFRQGGFSGGMDAMQQQMPNFNQNMTGMMDSARQGYNTGRGMYDQMRGIGQDAISDMRRLRGRFKTMPTPGFGGGFASAF